jgi:hypothetical protein
MKTRWRADDDGWTTDGEKINDPERLAAIRTAIEERGPIIVEWRHYRGSASPSRLVFDEFDEFEAWLAGTFAGDAFTVWDFDSVCRDDNALTGGKLPDERGEVPRNGAY